MNNTRIKVVSKRCLQLRICPLCSERMFLSQGYNIAQEYSLFVFFSASKISQDFPEQLTKKIKIKKRPNGLLAVLNISWHSPIFSRDGCIFCGRHSNPGVHYLHPDSATVESGCCSDYRHYFSSTLSFSFLLALEYTSLKWS